MNKNFRFRPRKFKSNTRRRLLLKRMHRKVNMRRQSFQNRELFIAEGSDQELTPPALD